MMIRHYLFAMPLHDAMLPYCFIFLSPFSLLRLIRRYATYFSITLSMMLLFDVAADATFSSDVI